MKHAKLILTLVLAVVAVILILQNTAQATISLLFFKATMPLAGLVLVTLVLGIGIGTLGALGMRRK